MPDMEKCIKTCELDRLDQPHPVTMLPTILATTALRVPQVMILVTLAEA